MAGIPQVITEDRASGAQFIDGSLKFDGSKSTRLTTTFASTGNRQSWTWSCWVKRDTLNLSNRQVIFGGYGANNNTDWLEVGFNSSSDKVYFTTSSISAAGTPERRDSAGWYHFFSTYDGSNLKIYVNNNLDLNHSFSGNRGINNNTAHYIGQTPRNAADRHLDGRLSQCYFIDGLALGPKYFGYTDPLTGTWRPRKFRAEGTTVNDGTDWSGSTTNLTNGPNGFNGNLGNYAEVSSSGAKGTVTFPKSIKVENSVTFWYSSGQPGNLFINDETTAMEVTGGFHQQDIEFTGTLSSVSIQSASQPAIWGIAVDGIILESTVTQNLAFGTNGFYLPMDGNSPIGQDKSGNGNDWTPVNFGGSVELPKATGAIPILNTNEAGTVAKRGVRTDKKTYTVTASGGNYYLDGALKPTLNAYRGGSYTFDYTGATSHPLYLSSLPDGKHNSKAYSVQFGGSDYLSVPDSDDFDLAGNDWTIEAFVYHSSTNYASYEGILAQWALGSGTDRTWTLETVGSGSTSDLEFYYVDTSNNQVGPVQGGTLTKDKWHHVAACRSGNTIRMFVDGVMYGNGTTINVDIKNSTDPLWVGRVVDGYWNGHISNARVVNGTALYTTNFTPPSTTLTNVTNTKLLCCQDSDATTGAVLPSGSTITVSGSAAASQTRQPFLYDNNHGNFGVNTATSESQWNGIEHQCNH